jgi:two-component system response regulator MprA
MEKASKGETIPMTTETPSGNNPACILVVDDEPEIRQLLKEVLELDGYRVTPAADGREALPLALREQPDLIITDIRMPKLDGLTLCKALRKNRDTTHIPILILTTLNTAADMAASFAAGADDFLPKPLNPDEIRIRVRSLLRLKQTYDALTALRQELAALRSRHAT